jgi:hypothetical protein
MSLLLAFDPGKRTGIAIFDFHTGELNSKFVCGYDELTTFVNCLSGNIAAIVVEDYIIRPGVGNRGHARGEAMRVIGQLEAASYRLSCRLVKQRPEVRLIAAKWSGTKVPKGHMPDDMSAELHGIYYLRQQGKYTTVLERERANLPPK